MLRKYKFRLDKRHEVIMFSSIIRKPKDGIKVFVERRQAGKTEGKE